MSSQTLMRLLFSQDKSSILGVAFRPLEIRTSLLPLALSPGRLLLSPHSLHFHHFSLSKTCRVQPSSRISFCSLGLGCFSPDINTDRAFFLISFKLLLNRHLPSEAFPGHLFKIANVPSLHPTLLMPHPIYIYSVTLAIFQLIRSLLIFFVLSLCPVKARLAQGSKAPMLGLPILTAEPGAE